MRSKSSLSVLCSVCGRAIPRGDAIRVHWIRAPLLDMIQGETGQELAPDGYLCRDDVNRFRALRIARVLQAEVGELGDLEREVLESLHKHELVSPATFPEKGEVSFGERLSDRLASFGGSWSFIAIFGFLLVAWMIVNSVQSLWRPFDPYPYILLNLVLSCLAAIQAPVIIMSQNRQEARDRQRAVNDYKVNLKAELEIRHLHEKMDHMMTHQWERLVEIQQIQIDLMEELSEERKRPGRP